MEASGDGNCVLSGSDDKSLAALEEPKTLTQDWSRVSSWNKLLIVTGFEQNGIEVYQRKAHNLSFKM